MHSVFNVYIDLDFLLCFITTALYVVSYLCSSVSVDMSDWSKIFTGLAMGGGWGLFLRHLPR